MKLMRNFRNSEKGAGLILAVISVLILSMVGGTFAMLVQNEARSAQKSAAYDQALYVAEAGVEEVLYLRSLNPQNMCYPFINKVDRNFTVGGNTQTEEGDIDFTGTGVGKIPPGKKNSAAHSNTCYELTTTDVDNTDSDLDFLPCWTYNEKHYENILTFGENFYCHDGSDPSQSNIGGQPSCGDYKPLAVWPRDDNSSDGIGWMPMDKSLDRPLSEEDATDNPKGRQRYTTGFFTVCNDDFRNDDVTVEPAKSVLGERTPPVERRVMKLSIVSVGEVVTGDGKEAVQRAVKVDVIPSALYTGVIDQYYDRTLTYFTTINGPVHINGWNDNTAGRYAAFLASDFDLIGGLIGDETIQTILQFFKPPELVSVSFPHETPQAGDWSALLLESMPHVHLPVRIDIPTVNWDKWLNRMRELYGDALGLTNMYLMKMQDYHPTNKYYTEGDGAVEYSCDSNQQDECQDPEDWFDFDCPPNTSDSGKMHNCRSSGWAVWNDVYFDLFDYYFGSPNNRMEGTESPSDLIGSGWGPRDKSLRYVTKSVYDLDLTRPGCSLDNLSGCLFKDVPRPQFVFMGRHEYRGKVFIDGVIGLGTRTPYHTCGTGDGFPLCISFDLFGISIEFGIPHWHLGKARVVGEMLVNGRLYMADYVNIQGGAIYADEDMIKDETSGLDVILDVSELICWLLDFVGIGWLCDIVMDLLRPILVGIFPWWPLLDLTNNGIIDFESYLDIDGGNLSNVLNSGTLFTRGNFKYEIPTAGLFIFLFESILSSLLPFLDLEPAIDPIRIYNYGAIVAMGKVVDGEWVDGDITLADHERMDLMTCDPDGGICDSASQASTGYAIAAGKLKVGSDIISHYGWGGLIDNCTEMMDIGWSGGVSISTDPDCATAGIFYSGGIVTQGEDSKTKMITRKECLNYEEPDFWSDPVNNALCWIDPVLGGDAAEFNVKGHFYAGKVGGMPATHVRLDQDPSVRHEAITRNYFRELGGVPVDWMEVNPPANLPSFTDR
ncbi:MAG: pilus assembly PilX N-terminal domain-containing protein [bacterium]